MAILETIMHQYGGESLYVGVQRPVSGQLGACFEVNICFIGRAP
jgi:hypothetical protein